MGLNTEDESGWPPRNVRNMPGSHQTRGTAPIKTNRIPGISQPAAVPWP